MLIQFTVGNFRSFKEPVTLSMVAAKIKSKEQLLDVENVFAVNERLSLLKSAAVYGANASGKSNLIAAMRFMASFVVNSFNNANFVEPIAVESFRLSTETAGEPSLFESVFLLEGVQYRYGFEVDTEGIASEWLYFVPKTKEAKLFERDLEGIRVSNRYKEGKGLEERTRKNALFLSVVAQFNGQIATQILRWFNHLRIINNLLDSDTPIIVEHFFRSDKQREIVQLIQRLDLGIDDIGIAQVPLQESFEGAKLVKPMFAKNENETRELYRPIVKPKSGIFYTLRDDGGREEHRPAVTHRKYDSGGRPVAVEHFDLEQESQGTQKLFALAWPLIEVLNEGSILIIDELDARLHPLITCEIIRLFNSQESNPHYAQLIFTTHDTNLLSNKLLRRDQIWFTEKDKYGATDLYSLVEYKGVRNDASFEKDYIQGRYGAIPFIGDLSGLFGERNGEKTN
jgi:AAA15 family ATPase/GTPase